MIAEQSTLKLQPTVSGDNDNDVDNDNDNASCLVNCIPDTLVRLKDLELTPREEHIFNSCIRRVRTNL